MLNPEVQKNKTSNSNLIGGNIRYCDTCNKNTYHMSLTCTSHNDIWKNNGIRTLYCGKCNIKTVHNGGICLNCKAIDNGYNSYNEYIIKKNIKKLKEFYKTTNLDVNKLNMSELTSCNTINMFMFFTLVGK